MIAKTGLLAVTLVSLAGAPAAAVDNDPKVDPERAAQLYAQAVDLLGTPHRWAEAASLLRRSATSLGEEDPAAFETMRFAGRVYAQAGDFGKARKALEEAAGMALSRGALVEAAHTYVEAAHAASAQGDGNRAVAMAEKARRIATSPLLPDAERATIGALVGAL